jgi:hypothetical protein
MGMYTELHLSVELTGGAPLEILRYMTGQDKGPGEIRVPDHPFFQTPRWAFMLQCDSAYFPAPTNSHVGKTEYGNCVLLVQCSFKNYYGEIDLFLEWLSPFVVGSGWKERDFVGYSLYEENEDPTPIYLQNGKLG